MPVSQDVLWDAYHLYLGFSEHLCNGVVSLFLIVQYTFTFIISRLFLQKLSKLERAQVIWEMPIDVRFDYLRGHFRRFGPHQPFPGLCEYEVYFLLKKISIVVRFMSQRHCPKEILLVFLMQID